MTFELVCKSCGAVLYSGFDLRRPSDILRAYGGRCEKCGRKLSPVDFKVQIARPAGS